MEPVIIVKNLQKVYPAKGRKNTSFTAVAGINFSVRQGEVFGILGPNGAGKTTTLEIIEGLKPQTAGRVEVLGLDNLKQTSDIKKQIGIQLQQSEYLHHLTLGELLDLFASLYGRSADRQKLLGLVDLQEKENAEFKDLSGGQKQRFTIATSLVHSPRILFLDEPTTGLDPAARRQMWQLIKTLNQTGLTIVLTTHFMEEAEFLCHRVAILDNGKILEIDEPKKLIDRLSETTQISFYTDSELPANFFAGLPDVRQVHAAWPKVILEISSLDKISAVVEILKLKKIPFYGFMVKTASLEDVYLDLTGKEYENE